VDVVEAKEEFSVLLNKLPLKPWKEILQITLLYIYCSVINHYNEAAQPMFLIKAPFNAKFIKSLFAEYECLKVGSQDYSPIYGNNNKH